jgi:hypothetical protein
MRSLVDSTGAGWHLSHVVLWLPLKRNSVAIRPIWRDIRCNGSAGRWWAISSGRLTPTAAASSSVWRTDASVAVAGYLNEYAAMPGEQAWLR